MGGRSASAYAARESGLHFLLLALFILAVRAWFTLAYRIDSDEPQHLHVAWAWTQGLVQYRDVFDNHLPLLHLLFTPLMAVVPESPSVFLIARAAIAPFAIACSWLVYAFAKPLYGTRIAIVAALCFSVLPPWLAKSVEFRNDTLWILFWLLALVLAVSPRGPFWFWMGVACALSFLASVKFAPIFIAHVLAFVTRRRPLPPPSALLRFAAGAALTVGAVCAFFAALGGLDEMVYATLLFNASAPVHPARRIAGVTIFVFVAAAIFVKGKRAPDLLLFAMWYLSVLLAFWPILTPRDYLPVAPVAAIGIAHWWRGHVLVPLMAGLLWSYTDARLWRGADPFRTDFVEAALRLTAPGDYVVDLKGDAVFRRRPIYYIYEDVGRALTARGKLPDDGPERIVAHGACAAIRDSDHLPPRTRAFLNRHFIGDGPLRVCGAHVEGKTFHIGVPQTYSVIARGPVTVDGVPYRGPRALGAGPHTVESTSAVTVVWSRAAKEWK